MTSEKDTTNQQTSLPDNGRADETATGGISEKSADVPRPHLFPLGTLVGAPGAVDAVPRDEALAAVHRHVTGDWSEVGDADRKENELSVKAGFRILSAHRTRSGTRFWIITEADRSATTILLPQEY